MKIILCCLWYVKKFLNQVWDEVREAIPETRIIEGMQVNVEDASSDTKHRRHSY